MARVPEPVRCGTCGRPCAAVCNTHTVHAVFGRMMRAAMGSDPEWALRMAKTAELDGA